MSFVSIFRIRHTWSAAAAFAALAFAAAARAATAAPCPHTLVMESSNGRLYVAVFAASVPMKSSFDITLYSKTNEYSIALSNISIEKPWKRGLLDSGFRSFTAVLRNPGDEPLLGAVVRPYDLADQAVCPGEEWIVPAVAAVTTAPPREAGDASLRAEIAAEAGDGSSAFALNPVSMQSALTCPTPFAAASIVEAAKPDYTPAPGAPPIVAYVRIEVGVTGAVTSATIFKSSNDPAFDRAAIVAARTTTYSPRIFGCEREASSYLFVARSARSAAGT